MGINGGGYTFIPPNMISKLLPDDIRYLLNGKNLAEDVLLRLSKPDGSQPYTVIKQYISTGGIAVSLNKNNTGIAVNRFMGKYLSIITLNQQFPAKLRHGVWVNGQAVTYQPCAKTTPINYFSFLPNEQELKPLTSHEHTNVYEVSGTAVERRSKAIRPYSGRRIPLEYFMFTEMHFSACGTYTSSDRWLNSKYPALGTAIGLR